MQVDQPDGHARPPGPAMGRIGGFITMAPPGVLLGCASALGAALATARMRMNAKMSAPSETATATNAFRLPSRLMTTWTVS